MQIKTNVHCSHTNELEFDKVYFEIPDSYYEKMFIQVMIRNVTCVTHVTYTRDHHGFTLLDRNNVVTSLTVMKKNLQLFRSGLMESTKIKFSQPLYFCPP